MLADRVGQILGLDTVIVPPNPGQFSALGLLRSDLMVTRARSIMTSLESASAETIETAFVELQDRIRGELSAQGAELELLRFERAIFAMYRSQTWDNRMPIAADAVTPEGVPELVARFHAFYQDSYGFAAPEIPVVVSTVEVTAVIPRDHGNPTPTPEPGEPLLRTVALTLPGTTVPATVPLFQRERLTPQVQVCGPALISEKFATTLVLAGRRAGIDEDFNLIIEPES
jgi:N-methylhydantoinase A